MFDQPELETVLRARMRELPLVGFRGDVEVRAVRPNGQNRPEVEYVDLGTQEVHRVRPRFVLGCDGANSTVRAAIGSTMQDLGLGDQRWLVVDIVTPRDLGHWGGVHQVCDSNRAATYTRMGETRHRWEFALRDDESAADYQDLDALAPLLAPWDTDTTDFELVRLAEYTFRARLADRWHRDGVFILGDAAHLTPPFIGQGMGAGIRDAANLAWKVAAVVDGILPVEVLDSYEAERAPHARAMIRLASLVGRAMTAGGPLGDRLRGIVVPLLVHLPGVRGRVLDSTTPALSRSSLVDRRRPGRGLAGTLCPNPVVAAGERLDAAAGDRWVVVSRAIPDDRDDELLRCHDTVVIDARETPELDRWLGRHQAALVRPDRTVMTVGTVDAVVRRAPFNRSRTTLQAQRS